MGGAGMRFYTGSIFGTFLAFCFAALLEDFLIAKTVAVTAVKVDQKSAEITLNDAILIRDIQVSREGALSIKFPEYVSKRGRVSPQVKILTQEVDEVIRKAIQTGKAQGSPKVWDPDKDVKITEFRRFTTDTGFFYIGEITFADAVSISCTIRKGKKGVRVSWPYRRIEDETARKRYLDQVSFLDKGLKDTIEKILLHQYESEEAKVKQTQQQKPTKKSTKEKLKEAEEE